MDSREYLTGCALIALSIEHFRTQAADKSNALLRAVNRLNRHSDGRNLERDVVESETPTPDDMARAAILLADFCLAGLQRTADPEHEYWASDPPMPDLQRETR